MIKIVLMLFFTIGLLYGSIEIELSDTHVANAQTMLVRLKADINEPKLQKIYAAYEGIRYPFYHDKFRAGRSFYALIPTSYYTKPKESKLVIVYVEDGQKYYSSYKITICEGNYKTEKLTVAPSRAKISRKNQQRIARERKEAMKIYNTKTKKLYIQAPLSYPLDSKITSAFGNKRLFNGVLKSYHSGTDFRAKKGTPIKAVARGRVVLTKKRFFAGNSVIIDHGQGIYTCYYHLSRFKVKKGDFVKKGSIIGLAGATGRVTGPHLHFSVRVNGVQVDPLQFIDTIDILFER